MGSGISLAVEAGGGGVLKSAPAVVVNAAREVPPSPINGVINAMDMYGDACLSI